MERVVDATVGGEEGRARGGGGASGDEATTSGAAHGRRIFRGGYQSNIYPKKQELIE